MNLIFSIVYGVLLWLSSITGFTYREMNIIVYYIIAPLVFLHLVDRIVGRNYFKIGFIAFVAVVLLLIKDFEAFSSYLFDRSVDFLNLFEVVGWNYIEASVIICVFVPIVILAVLQLVKVQLLRTKKDNAAVKAKA